MILDLQNKLSVSDDQAKAFDKQNYHQDWVLVVLY